MYREISSRAHSSLADYRAHVALAPLVDDLVTATRQTRGALEGRRVWMLNSTACGGGVAEMLPGLVNLMRELGVDVRWLVIEPRTEGFFELTKRLHNLLHDAEGGTPSAADRQLYRRVSEILADAIAPLLRPEDLLVVHDPQPLGCGATLVERVGLSAIWRCHIGLDRETPRTRRGWEFLRPWLAPYRRYVFSLPDYAPAELKAKAAVLPPAIDPLTHKNRELSIHKLTGILRAGQLVPDGHPEIAPPFAEPVRRLVSGGDFVSAQRTPDLGLLFRPMVVQISRWDRLKGWDGLLEGFARMKARSLPPAIQEHGRRRIEYARLVLAGPDPDGVGDDPEAGSVLHGLARAWSDLPPALREDVALLLLPMDDAKCNALLVNALQRCAAVAVQNSYREGFGLTVTEAMWKASAVLGSSAAGIRAQIRDGVEGRIIEAPRDPERVADLLTEMLSSPKACDTYGLNARRRTGREFLVFAYVERWLALLAALGGPP